MGLCRIACGHGLSGTDLAKPSRAATIAYVLNLNPNIVGVGEIELRRSQRTRRAAAIVGALTPPHSARQRFDERRDSALNRFETVVDQYGHDPFGVEVFDCEAYVIDAGNRIGVICRGVEGDTIRSLADREGDDVSLHCSNLETEHSLIEFLL